MQPLLTAFAVLLTSTQVNPKLIELEAKHKEFTAKRENVYAGGTALNEKVHILVSSNELKSAEEFRRAAEIFTRFQEFDVSRTRYELLYTAVAMGDSPARKLLAEAWDEFTVSVGHRRTLGAGNVFRRESSVRHLTNLAPTSVRAIFNNPPTARLVTVDNEEIAAMFKADQEVRQGDFDEKRMKEMVDGDAKRMKRIRQLVNSNKLKSATDFYNAAFLFQHGDCFEDYHMAHQLSVCSKLLGGTGAKWIGAASYDRMLLSMGHKQRWVTQYRIDAGKTILQAFDDNGICDNQRKFVIGKTLDEAKNVKFD